MTVTTELHLPFRKRLRLLFGGSIFVAVNIDSSWFVRLHAWAGDAWISRAMGNDVLPFGAFRVHASRDWSGNGSRITDDATRDESSR